MKTKPYPFQIEGVNKICAFKGRALLADSMGLGKTLQALMFAEDHPDLRPIIVVCPASIKWNWESEARKHFGMRAEILEGTKPPNRRKSRIIMASKLLVINFDILHKWVDFLRGLKPQIIVIDESHYCGNRRSRRTKSVQKLCKKVPHVIALSGTPLTNRPAELWPILNILRPRMFNAFWPFAMRFCKPRRTPFGWDVRGASRMKELHQILKMNLMIRRLKKDVMAELPDKQRIVVPVDIQNRKEYNYALHNFRSWIADKHPTKLSKVDKAERLVQLGYLKRLAAKLKLKEVFNWIDSFFQESDEKLVVFAVHKRIIKALKLRYQNKCVVLDGSTPAKQRQIAVRQFQTNKKVKLFIGNIKAAGVGITLTAASTVLFAEVGWTPGEHSQAEDRIHRIGQKATASCYYLIAKETIEEELVKLIQKKQTVLNAVLEGKGRGDDFNIFDQLTLRLKRKAG